MRIHIVTLLVVFNIVFTSVYGQINRIWDLKHCIEMAMENNPIVHRSLLSLQAEKINYRQSWQNQMPSLQANVNHGINQGRNIDPTTNQFIEETINAGNQSLTTDVMVLTDLEFYTIFA